MYENWQDVSRVVDTAVAADGRPFDDATIANIHLLIAVATGKWRPPDNVGAGYWPTLSLSWSLEPAPIEIEVHPNGYEFYQFFEGRSDIREFKSKQSIVFPPELIRTLNALIATSAP